MNAQTNHEASGAGGPVREMDAIVTVGRLTNVQRIWDRYGDAESWNFITNGLKNGDLFFVLGFMRAFRKIHGGDVSIRFLADTDGKFRLLNLFKQDIDFGEFVPELARVSNQEIAEWCEESGRDKFAPGSLIRLHPYLFSDGQYQISSLLRNPGCLHLVELFKTALRLPLNIAPGFPVIRDELMREAKLSFNNYSLLEKNTVIIFPYAQTLAFDAMPVLSAFAKIAVEAGLTVCSAVYGDEQPVPNTRPIRVSFDTLIPFCELAGYVVSLRSGIGDMLSNAILKKAILYFNEGLEFFESPNSYGMCDCSGGIVVKRDETPLATAQLCLETLARERYSRKADFVPLSLLRYFQLCCSRTGVTEFKVSNGCTLARYILFPEAVLAEGWYGIESWGVWSCGFRAVLYAINPEYSGNGESFIRIIEFDLVFALNERYPSIVISIDINGERAALNCCLPQNQMTVSIPLSQMQAAAACHRVIFSIDSPNSPKEATGGENGDGRLIGVGLRGLKYVHS